MKVTAWNNGKHQENGAGYGLKVTSADRDAYFNKNWSEVILHLPNLSIAHVNISKSSFWNGTCRELIGQEIGRWLLTSGLAPWENGSPPKFSMSYIGGNNFRVE